MQILVKGFGFVEKKWAEKEAANIASKIKHASSNELNLLSCISEALCSSKERFQINNVTRLSKKVFSVRVSKGTANYIAHYFTNGCYPTEKEIYKDFTEEKKEFFLTTTKA